MRFKQSLWNSYLLSVKILSIHFWCSLLLYDKSTWIGIPMIMLWIFFASKNNVFLIWCQSGIVCCLLISMCNTSLVVCFMLILKLDKIVDDFTFVLISKSILFWTYVLICFKLSAQLVLENYNLNFTTFVVVLSSNTLLDV